LDARALLHAPRRPDRPIGRLFCHVCQSRATRPALTVCPLIPPASAASLAAPQRGKAHNAVETALARAAESGGTLTLQPRKRGAAAMAAAAGGSSDGEEDPELAAALAASLEHYQSSQGGGGGGSGEAGGGGDGAGPSGSGRDVAGGGGGAAGTELAAAVAAGPGDFGGFDGGFEDDDPELAAALAASLEEYGRDQQQGQAEGAGGPSAAAAGAEVPADTAAAPAVAIPDEPEEGMAGALTVGLRLRDGKVVTRRWRATDTVAQLRAFAALQLGGGGGGSGGGVLLATSFPRRVLGEDGAALAAAGVEDRSVLTVT
jgi:hypothetical protein